MWARARVPLITFQEKQAGCSLCPDIKPCQKMRKNLVPDPCSLKKNTPPFFGPFSSWLFPVPRNQTMPKNEKKSCACSLFPQDKHTSIFGRFYLEQFVEMTLLCHAHPFCPFSLLFLRHCSLYRWKKTHLGFFLPILQVGTIRGAGHNTDTVRGVPGPHKFWNLSTKNPIKSKFQGFGGQF